MPVERLYRCAVCKETFETDISLEEALAEGIASWPGYDINAMHEVCADCLKELEPPAADAGGATEGGT